MRVVLHAYDSLARHLKQIKDREWTDEECDTDYEQACLLVEVMNNMLHWHEELVKKADNEFRILLFLHQVRSTDRNQQILFVLSNRMLLVCLSFLPHDSI